MHLAHKAGRYVYILFDVMNSHLTDEEFGRLEVELFPSGNALEFTGRNFIDQVKGETFVGGTLF
nr:hypothetical protein [uncultured Desulfobacter sp.]